VLRDFEPGTADGPLVRRQFLLRVGEF
jgi:hypothetical protein